MPSLSTLKTIYQKRGITGVSRFVYKRFFTAQPYDYRILPNINLYTQLFRGKKGIEIGGPSQIFSLEVPIYKVIDALDGCNFGNDTIWEGKLEQGRNYKYIEGKTGWQFISEASHLVDIDDERYDFLLGSHVLEHCANPIKAIGEWLRVIRAGGILLLVLPDKRFTFDHRRNVTTFEHLLDDYKRNVGEDDLTHLEEIMELHDIAMDSKMSGIDLTDEVFRKRSMDNLNNRALHQHVFDFPLMQRLFDHFGVETLDKSFAEPFHQIILGRKNEPRSNVLSDGATSL
jgi:SAM-dependent methyltransferase